MSNDSYYTDLGSLIPIAKELHKIIEDKRTKPLYNHWKDMYETIQEEFDGEIESSRTTIAELSNDRLSIKQVEEEGYLRCLLEFKKRMEYYRPSED